MKKLFLFILSLPFFALIVVILLLGYMGFIPSLAKVFGADKPRDLGVIATQEDYDAYLDKAQTRITSLMGALEGKSIFYEGSIPLSTSFSQQEISSRLSYSNWLYMPLDQIQVRLSPEGTIEISGRLRLERLDGFLSQVGSEEFSRDEVEQGLGILGLMTANPAVYAKGTASVANNQVTANVERLEVGRLSVPLDHYKVNQTLVSLANHIINNVPGLYIENADFEGGQLNFEGTVPSTMQILQQ